jgi:hypothetical protein
MESNSPNSAPEWGFFSSDGFFQPLRSLTTRGLEFVSRSTNELHLLLDENIARERYETCALIRDELQKRVSQSA